MRTVRTKVYKFQELKDQAKEKAIEHYRQHMDCDNIYDDAHETVKVFHDVFGTKEGHRSWLDVNTDGIDSDILELTGLRLQKYIWNNYRHRLYKGKYYSLWSKVEKSYKHHAEGRPVLKSRRSRVIMEAGYALTGMCYDDSLLEPMYAILERYAEKAKEYESTTFEELIRDCFHNLEKDLESEEEAMRSDEAISEILEINDYEFYQDGRMY